MVYIICMIKMTLWLLFCLREKEGEGGEVKYGGWNLDIFFGQRFVSGAVLWRDISWLQKKCAAPNFFSGANISKQIILYFFSEEWVGVILGAQRCSLAGGYMDAT